MSEIFVNSGENSNNFQTPTPRLQGLFLPGIDNPLAVDGLGIVTPWGGGGTARKYTDYGYAPEQTTQLSDLASSLIPAEGGGISYNLEGLVGPQGERGRDGLDGIIHIMGLNLPQNSNFVAALPHNIDQINQLGTAANKLTYTDVLNTYTELIWTERQPAGDAGKDWVFLASDSDGSNLIAAVDGGRLYTSDDYGVTWTERTPAGAADKNWQTVASDSDGSHLIVVISGERIYTSADSGVSWTERRPIDDDDYQWGALASDADGSNLIVAEDKFDGGLFTSADYGATWTERTVPLGANDAYYYAAASDSDGSHLIVGSDERLYTSSNYGATWTERQPDGDTDHAWDCVASDADGSNLIAGVYGGGLYTSADSGVNWTLRQPIAGNQIWFGVASDSTGTNLIAVIRSGRIYISNDSGATWAEEQPAGATTEWWSPVAMDSDGSHYAVAYNGFEDGRLYTGVLTTLYSETTWAETDFTSAGRALLAAINAAAQATVIGLGTGDAVTHDTLTLSSIAAEGSDVDKFLVDSTGVIKFRTGAEVLSDIGASASAHLHDTQTLQHDGVNSDGGTFSFATTGLVTFNQAIAVDSAAVTSINLLTLESDINNANEYNGILFKVVGGQNYGAIRSYIGGTAGDSYMSLFTTTDGGTLVRQVTVQHNGKVGFGTYAPETLLTMVSAAPYLTLYNNTEEDTDGGGESRIIGKREDGAGTPTAAGQIEISHDGSGANDQLGKIILSVNTGAELAQALEIGSDLLATFAGNIVIPDVGYIGSASDPNAIQIAANGEVTFTDVVTGITPTAGTHFATKEYVDLALGARKTFFLSNTGSGVGSLNYAYPYETSDEQSTIVTDPALGADAPDPQLIKGFITETGEPATTTIHAGVIIFHLHAKKGASNQRTTVLNAILSKVAADGTSSKVTVATTEDSAELTDTETTYTLHATLGADVEILGTDRLILDVYASVGAGAQDVVVTLYMEGTEDSYFSAAVDSGIWQNQGDVLDDLNTLGIVGADSEFLVGTAEGILAWESGATARTSLGVDAAGTASGLIGTHESTYNHGNYNTAYSHSQASSGNPHSVTPTELSLVIGTNTQAWDASLDSVAGLGYVSPSFIKKTGADTYVIRTIAQTKTDLSLNNVSNVATDDTAYNATSWDANSDAATKNAIRDKVETMDTAIGLNTAKNTNIPTALSAGTITATTYGITSDGGANDIVLPEADTNNAGLLGADKWDEIVANTVHLGTGSGNPHSVTPTELSLVIGTNTQAWGAILDDFNTLTPPASDGQFIVATGAGAFAYESGTTVRTSMGLGTGDSPTWAGATITGCSVLGLNSAVFQPAAGGDSTTFFQVLDADGGTPIFNVDTVNERVEIGATTPGLYMLAPFNITGKATNINDRHEGIWIRGKTAGFIVQINVRGSRLEIGGGVSLDTTPAMSVDYLTGNLTVASGIELGHASDTTITRASAGDVNIEGNLIYRAGGTDVPIGDGGTGQETAQAAIDALSAVSGGTNEHVLTKDTATGNAKWKAATGGGGDVSKQFLEVVG